VRPVGEDRAVPVDVRILAATHADLEQRVRDGTFREDLFLTAIARRERAARRSAETA
jgi:transcriptional regulator with GAF, ATPase, and Fis domain